MTEPTASQTVGPFFHLGLPDTPGCADTAAARVLLAGHVRDGAGAAVPDALIELWQRDPAGARWPDGGFQRCAVDAGGRFRFLVVKPGAGPDEAPHLAVTVFARGLLRELHTRIYFPDDPARLARDPVLVAVPAARRATLVATAADAGYRFDIHLQGPAETVFFDA
mgnify:CR=1 FL=1